MMEGFSSTLAPAPRCMVNAHHKARGIAVMAGNGIRMDWPALLFSATTLPIWAIPLVWIGWLALPPSLKWWKPELLR